MSKKLPNLEVLRGFLALCVVIFHIPSISKTVELPNFSGLPILHRGHEAVYAFFTLSGFLIVNLLYQEKKNSGTINIKNFFLRRILRIYPVYYVVLIIGFLYYHYLLPKFGIPYEINYKLAEGIALAVGFMPNVFRALHQPGSILLILWSIGIEEQFYILIAFATLIIPVKRYVKTLLIFTIIYFILYFLPEFDLFRRFYMYFFYMSFGGAIAILNSENKINFLVFKKLPLKILIYSAFILHFFTNYLQFENQAIRHFLSMILFGIFILNISSETIFIVKNRFINHLGKVSYGIYMYHMIVINFVLFLFLKFEIASYLSNWQTIILINLICIIGTILVSHFSYEYFEIPFLRLKNRFRKNYS
jgi:peptidoglycan/LPS O-acetylase OafA/YrhL